MRMMNTRVIRGGTTYIMLKNGIPMYENKECKTVADDLRSYFRLKSIGRFYVEYDNGSLYLKHKV